MATSVVKAAFKTRLEKFSPESVWHFVAVSKKIADKLKFEGKSKRVFCTLNGSEPFQCALMPYRGDFFIMVNKTKRTKLGLIVGDEVQVLIEKDDSKYGLPMPDEFTEVLNQDPTGSRMFHALTPGKQRSLIYAVSSQKNIDKRIHIALIILEHLKKNDGKIVDKILYEEVKRPIF